jgi:hypothetical protein
VKRQNAVLVALVSTAGLWSCTCGDEQRNRVLSSDNKLGATFYVRNCGATTDFSSIVDLDSASSKFDGDTNMLFVAKGRYDVQVRWTGPRSLLIRCGDCLRRNVFREVTILGDVDITYDIGRERSNREEHAIQQTPLSV